MYMYIAMMFTVSLVTFLMPTTAHYINDIVYSVSVLLYQ